MKTKKRNGMLPVSRIPGLVFIGAFLLVLCSATPAENRNIRQAEKRVVIDGNLEEWQSVPSFLVKMSPAQTEVEPSDDISASVRFMFDAKRFYVAVEVIDDRFEFPSRSWRYGDGFLLTFFDPVQGNAGDRFSTFGFSQIKNKPAALLLNRDGVYFPPVSLQDLDLEIAFDEKKNMIRYEIAIPFTLLTPFRPFIQKSWGINLTYADRDGEERELVQLFPDPGFDTELSRVRRGEVFDFILRSGAVRARLQGLMSASHYFDDDPKVLVLGIQNPRDEEEWTLRYNLSSAPINREGRAKLHVPPGWNRIEWVLEEKAFPTEAYVLSVGVIDGQGSLLFTQDNPFFVLNRSEMETMTSELDEARAGELFSEEARFRNSFPSVDFRVSRIEEYMDRAHPHEDMTRIHQFYVDFDFLMERIRQKEPALFLPGRIGRLAHVSEIDGTLQPYSVYVPEFYNGEEALPLLVTLHGSGVDEKQSIRLVAQTMLNFHMSGKAGRFLILAPQARGLSDWYLGDAGMDVMECIAHVKTLYNVDERRIMLDGFSMGGYGAWRLGLRYPDVFRAVVIRSGAIAPPDSIGGENILDLMKPQTPNSFFVVHGAKDNAVSVSNARSAVQKLEELGIDHRYVEVKDAAHGGYDKWSDILTWLKRKVKWKDLDPSLKQRRKKCPIS